MQSGIWYATPLFSDDGAPATCLLYASFTKQAVTIAPATCLFYSSFFLGRDGARATCLLYASFGDTFRQSTMVFTEQTGLAKLYSMVTYAFDLSK